MPGQFGHRLRTLRVAKGLQQSDLAGPGVSASYISMLENGNREPTPRVIEHLSTALGVDPLELAGPTPRKGLSERQHLELASAEFALATGEGTRAVQEYAALEAELGLPATWGLARSLEATGDLEAALAALDGVVRAARGESVFLVVVRAQIARSRCLAEIGEDVAALEAAREARITVEAEGLIGTDEHAQALSTLVGQYYNVGDLLNAEGTARELLTLVDAGSSCRARGSAYWNAAGIAEASGDMDKAVAYAERAVALLSEDDDERAWARCAIACAWFWMRHEDVSTHLDTVDRLLREAATKLATVGTDVDRAYLETEQAWAALLRGNAVDAVRLAQQALGRLGDQPRVEAADTLLVLAQAHLQQGHAPVAAEMADRLELTLLSLSDNRTLAHTWRGLGDAYKTLGNHEAAYRALEHALNAQTISASPDLAKATQSNRVVRR